MSLGVFPEGTEEESDLTKLQNYALEIERKFETGRAADIDPVIANKILQTAKRIREGRQYPLIISRLIEIENRCYAAIINYKDAPNRAHFFGELRNIAEIISAVISGA